MDLKENTYKVIGKRLRRGFDSKNYVEWAVEAINLGYHSESLIILAGLDYALKEERESYFWKTVHELDLDFERNELILAEDYAKYIAKAVLENRISPESGLYEMTNVFRSSNYNSKYSNFSKIQEDIDLLSYDDIEIPIYNLDLNLDNADDFIKKEFKLFLNKK